MVTVAYYFAGPVNHPKHYPRSEVSYFSENNRPNLRGAGVNHTYLELLKQGAEVTAIRDTVRGLKEVKSNDCSGDFRKRAEVPLRDV